MSVIPSNHSTSTQSELISEDDIFDIQGLPPELIAHIVCILPSNGQLHCMRVSRHWLQLFSTEGVLIKSMDEIWVKQAIRISQLRKNGFEKRVVFLLEVAQLAGDVRIERAKQILQFAKQVLEQRPACDAVAKMYKMFSLLKIEAQFDTAAACGTFHQMVQILPQDDFRSFRLAMKLVKKSLIYVPQQTKKMLGHAKDLALQDEEYRDRRLFDVLIQEVSLRNTSEADKTIDLFANPIQKALALFFTKYSHAENLAQAKAILEEGMSYILTLDGPNDRLHGLTRIAEEALKLKLMDLARQAIKHAKILLNPESSFHALLLQKQIDPLGAKTTQQNLRERVISTSHLERFLDFEAEHDLEGLKETLAMIPLHKSEYFNESVNVSHYIEKLVLVDTEGAKQYAQRLRQFYNPFSQALFVIVEHELKQNLAQAQETALKIPDLFYRAWALFRISTHQPMPQLKA